MIGLEQEPNDDARGKLNAALGEGHYTVEYRETAGGVAIVVQTREMPSRVWSSQVAHGVPRASVDGVWQELTSRITAESKGKPTTTAAHARQQASDGEQASIHPPEDVRGALDALLGKDAYRIGYSRRWGGGELVAEVRTLDATGERRRAAGISFPSDATRDTVESMWREAVANWRDDSRSLGEAPPIETIGIQSEVHNPPVDDSRSLGEVPASNPESHGYPPIPDDLIKPRDDVSAGGMDLGGPVAPPGQQAVVPRPEDDPKLRVGPYTPPGDGGKDGAK